MAIARAFVAGPDLVICDEPLSSLDVSVQGALMNLLLDLQGEAGTSYLFISHDLAAVQHLSHLIGVMYLGKLVEQGEAAQVLSPPYHPYTEALLSAVPDLDPSAHAAPGAAAPAAGGKRRTIPPAAPSTPAVRGISAISAARKNRRGASAETGGRSGGRTSPPRPTPSAATSRTRN